MFECLVKTDLISNFNSVDDVKSFSSNSKSLAMTKESRVRFEVQSKQAGFKEDLFQALHIIIHMGCTCKMLYLRANLIYGISF